VRRAAREHQRGVTRAVIGDDQQDRGAFQRCRFRRRRRFQQREVARDRRAQGVVVAQDQLRRAQ
jgi:hypothetical protein